MDIKVLLTVFVTVFIAEPGDKTRLAAVLFASDRAVSKWAVFPGASLALVVTSGAGGLTGGLIAEYISEKHLHYMAGIGIGVWTLVCA